MAVAQAPLTEVETRVQELFLAEQDIKLRDDETIGAQFLQELCMHEWRRGRDLRLVLKGGKIDGNLTFNYVRTDALLDLQGVKLGRLRLRHATFNALVMKDCDVLRIEAMGLETARGVDLNGKFHAHERVRLVAATIGGDLSCNDATFGRSPKDRKEGWSALILDSARVEGNIDLNRVHADGYVSAWRVRVRGAFNASRAILRNNQGGSLNLRDAGIGQGGDFSYSDATGVVDLGDASFGSGVSFKGATIAGDLNLQGCEVRGELSLDILQLSSWEPDPEDEYRRKAKASPGSIVLRDARLAAVRMVGPATVAGSVDAARAMVDGDLVLNHVTIGGPEIELSGARIAGTLGVRAIEAASEDGTAVKLQGVTLGGLDDGPGGWPQRDRDEHLVDGLRITALGRPCLKWRIRWLKTNSIWSPQPWQEIGAALRRQGHEEEARKIAIAREIQRTGQLPWRSKPARWVLRWTIGYGYKPLFALGWALGIVMVCAGLFKGADFHSDADAPESGTILYSIDAFLPVDLGYFNSWTPHGVWWNALAILEAASGWVLAALLLGALTGLLKRD
jgi:cytoskeletal protein CcmA (bactofilin family)